MYKRGILGAIGYNIPLKSATVVDRKRRFDFVEMNEMVD